MSIKVLLKIKQYHNIGNIEIVLIQNIYRSSINIEESISWNYRYKVFWGKFYCVIFRRISLDTKV